MVKNVSPFLEPQQTEHTANAKIFLEHTRNRNASVQQIGTSFVTYTRHERGRFTYQSKFSRPVVVHWYCRRYYFSFRLDHTTLQEVFINRPDIVQHISTLYTQSTTSDNNKYFTATVPHVSIICWFNPSDCLLSAARHSLLQACISGTICQTT